MSRITTTIGASTVMVSLFLSACFQSDDARAADGGDTPRLHPLEKYCLTYELKGMMQGSWVECSRKFGHERYELQNTEVKLGPISQKDNKRVVYVGKNIYSIPEKGQPTVAENPMYDGVVAALEDSDPMTLSDNMLSGMGYTATGKTDTILGKPCNIASGMGGTLCMTDDGLVLRMDVMGQTRTAVSIDLDSGGDDANYAIPDDVKKAPSLSDIQDMMKGMGNQGGG